MLLLLLTQASRQLSTAAPRGSRLRYKRDASASTTHGMAGIKRDEVYPALGIDPEKYQVICGFVLGVLDTKENLNQDFVEGEQPSGRDALDVIWMREE